jgi:anti-sigma regulatory factor (Ser/Thr protein kinase)
MSRHPADVLLDGPVAVPTPTSPCMQLSPPSLTARRHPAPVASGAPLASAAGTWPRQSLSEVAAAPAAVRGARRHARRVLWTWDLECLADTAELVVSELVTNAIQAVRASAGPLPVRLWLAADHARLAVGVWDCCPDPPRLAQADEIDENGRGLFLVEALSATWDWCPQDGGKVVRAVLEPAHPA